MPNGVRSIILRVIINTLDNLNGVLINPALVNSIANFIWLLSNLIPNLFSKITNDAPATKPLNERNDIRIAEAPFPPNTNAYPMTNFRQLPTTSISKTLLTSDIPRSI